jgi:flagellar hook-associated protein 3 FlgL
MRITGTRLIELATTATSRAQERVADASDIMSSGMRVERASQDPTAWAAGRRAADRATLSSARGDAIGATRTRLAETDRALGAIGGIVESARALAIQGANDTLDPNARAAIGAQMQQLFAEALGAANTQTSDGEYVLAGGRSDVAPFDAAGVYNGDAGVRSLETAEGVTQAMSVPGSTLTAASGIDVLPTLSALATALSTNDRPGIQAAIANLELAGKQVSRARGDGGGALAALDSVDQARAGFEVELAKQRASAVEADPIAAASALAQSAQALEGAQAVAVRVIALVRPRQ